MSCKRSDAMGKHAGKLPEWLGSFKVGEVRWWPVPENDGDNWTSHPPTSRTKGFSGQFSCRAYIAHDGSLSAPSVRLFRVERLPKRAEGWVCAIGRKDCKANCGNYGCGRT